MVLTRSFLRLAALVLLLVAAALPARAADLADRGRAASAATVSPPRSKAIEALGKIGDPRAVPILKALGDDRLLPSRATAAWSSSTPDGDTTRADRCDQRRGGDRPSRPTASTGSSSTTGCAATSRRRSARSLWSAPIARTRLSRRAGRAEASLCRAPPRRSKRRWRPRRIPRCTHAMQRSLFAARLLAGTDKTSSWRPSRRWPAPPIREIKNLLDEFAQRGPTSIPR